MHKNDYRKSSKIAGYDNFLLQNEDWKLVMDWYKSTLPPHQVFSMDKKGNPDTSNNNNGHSSDKRDGNNDDDNNDDDDDGDESGDDDPAIVDSNVVGGFGTGTKIRLSGARWKHGLDIETVERDFALCDLTVETKKALRWIQNKQSHRQRLEEWEKQARLEIFDYSCARLQYSAVHNSSIVITTMKSTDKHHYGKNPNRMALRYNTFLIWWSDSGNGVHSMSSQRISCIFLFSQKRISHLVLFTLLSWHMCSGSSS